MRKKQLGALSVGMLGLTSLFLVIVLFNPSRLDSTLELASEHLIVGAILLVILRIIGMIVPVVPAGIVSFAVIPIFGWFPAYIYSATGIVLGTSIAFFLARRYKERLVARFVPLKKIHELQKEISGKKEFLAILAFRLFTVPVVDISSYIAGLTKISYKKFALATFLATLPMNFTYYFGEEAYRRIFGKNLAVGVITMLIIGSIYLIIKRYYIKFKN